LPSIRTHAPVEVPKQRHSATRGRGQLRVQSQASARRLAGRRSGWRSVSAEQLSDRGSGTLPKSRRRPLLPTPLIKTRPTHSTCEGLRLRRDYRTCPDGRPEGLVPVPGGHHPRSSPRSRLRVRGRGRLRTPRSRRSPRRVLLPRCPASPASKAKTRGESSRASRSATTPQPRSCAPPSLIGLRIPQHLLRL
jgi:hypothetical protein